LPRDLERDHPSHNECIKRHTECAAEAQFRQCRAGLEQRRFAKACSRLQSVPAQLLVIRTTVMTLNVFPAGRDLVRWEVTAVSADGPYRLGVYHPGGAIVEYFTSVSAALERERELEGLFADGREGYEPAAMVAGD
jgi:hypothetical protein